jgi:phenylacetate-CoA ligase
LQNAACNLQGWRIKRSRFGHDFPALLRETESRSAWSGEKVNDYRNQRLRAFIRHCAQTVPFYRRQFRERGISPEDIQTLEDLQCLPILTKAEIQPRLSELISEAVSNRDQLLVHTSGTTGGGFHFATTRQAVQQQWAVWCRYRRWHGIEPQTWCGYFGGRSVVPLSQGDPPFWRYNYSGRQILFSGYHLSPANLGAYVKELRRRQPPWLHGYPSLMALLAAYLLESKEEIDYEPKWITTGAENLLPHQANLIEGAFGVRPKQHYGMAEAIANISECERGALHIDEDFAAVELVPNPGSIGYKIVGTNFTNPATPLLRYDVYDTVTALGEACLCGRPGRTVTGLDGRLEDYVLLKNGVRLGRLDHIFKDMIHIREAQIYQNRLDGIVIRIVRGDDYGHADERQLLAETRKRVGDDTEISLEYVERLERSRTGKLRFVVSELSSGKSNGIHLSKP